MFVAFGELLPERCSHLIDNSSRLHDDFLYSCLKIEVTLFEERISDIAQDRGRLT